MLSKSSAQTKRFAAKLAAGVAKMKSRREAVVIALTGDLGSGKTTFVQGFARSLGITSRILSPTFLIFRKYRVPIFKFKVPSFKFLYHVDAYRLKNSRELTALGFRDVMANPQNIIVVEWADRIKNLLPKSARWIFLSHGENIRERLISGQR